MKTLTATVASKKFGMLLDEADAGPVTILKDGRPRAVVLNARAFRAYAAAYAKESNERFIGMINMTLDLLDEGKLGESDAARALARRLRLEGMEPGDAAEIDALRQEKGE
ncbi:MAG: hypothetical protein ACK4NP_14340 [Parvularculaceae bacterium]